MTAHALALHALERGGRDDLVPVLLLLSAAVRAQHRLAPRRPAIDGTPRGAELRAVAADDVDLAARRLPGAGGFQAYAVDVVRERAHGDARHRELELAGPFPHEVTRRHDERSKPVLVEDVE